MHPADMPPAVAELIELTTLEQFHEEDRALSHALPRFFEHFQKERMQVYSLRHGEKVMLTLSVNDKGICANIFCAQNRPPTRDELLLVTEMLLDMGVMVRYEPSTISPT